MATQTLVSKTGAPVVELFDWVQSKNNPAFTALFDMHVQMFTDGQDHIPGANTAMDDMFNQFFAETNQEIVK